MFSLITALVKIIPDKVLDKILDILAAVGESTVTQVGWLLLSLSSMVYTCHSIECHLIFNLIIYFVHIALFV